MVWTQRANFKGEPGDPGKNVELRVTGGNIEWRQDGGAWTTLVPLATITGPAGDDGTSVTIAGSVANAAALPTGLAAGDAGDGYITQDNGHLHVWDGDSFNDVGTVRGPQGTPGEDGTDGINGQEVSLQKTATHVQWRLGLGAWTNLIALSEITGPQGIQGTPGTDGEDGLRGTQIFTGSGTPTTVPGSAPGDLYIDIVTGILYELS